MISYTPDYIGIVAGAMSKCYERKVGAKGVIKHAVEAGHFSSLEHINITLDLECSLAVLGQLTRHRHMSFTVKSSRGAEFSHEDFILPAHLEDNVHMIEVIEYLIGTYLQALKDGMPHEDASYILPKATRTKLRVTANARTWFEYLPKRLCRRAMPEHIELAIAIHEVLKENMPELFDRNFKKCGECKEHGCSFH